jgi:putative SOS response-associated peptidase YedK
MTVPLAVGMMSLLAVASATRWLSPSPLSPLLLKPEKSGLPLGFAASNVKRPPICHNLLMCGRYRLSRRKQVLEEYFVTASGDDDWSPRYNIAPTQPVPVIRQNPREPVRELSLMRWGLIPSWAKDSSVAVSMINARSETAATKPAFRDALKSRRCLIPADGFYEWQKNGKAKQPYCFEVNEGELFAFAGIWDRWKNPNGNWMKTCSILTTTPNAVTSAVHDRMPVILDPDGYDLWLDPGMRDVATASELLRPFDARLMRSCPVSTRINNVANDDETCSAPVELAEGQQWLFV